MVRCGLEPTWQWASAKEVKWVASSSLNSGSGHLFSSSSLNYLIGIYYYCLGTKMGLLTLPISSQSTAKPRQPSSCSCFVLAVSSSWGVAGDR